MLGRVDAVRHAACLPAVSVRPEEALLAATVGGARALGLTDRGALAPGQLADIQVWRLPSFEDVIYRLGNNAVERMIKRGRVSVSRPQERFDD